METRHFSAPAEERMETSVFDHQQPLAGIANRKHWFNTKVKVDFLTSEK